MGSRRPCTSDQLSCAARGRRHIGARAPGLCWAGIAHLHGETAVTSQSSAPCRLGPPLSTARLLRSAEKPIASSWSRASRSLIRSGARGACGGAARMQRGCFVRPTARARRIRAVTAERVRDRRATLRKFCVHRIYCIDCILTAAIADEDADEAESDLLTAWGERTTALSSASTQRTHSRHHRPPIAPRMNHQPGARS